MKRSTRWIGLVWLALVLNVLSPVIGYARVASARGPLTVELCHAAGAQQVRIGADDDASKTHPVVAHCVYCPGFAANFTLGASLPAVSSPVRAFAHVRTFEPQTVLVRRSVRVAQPRAPPETLI
ncbi:DUF2946 domain-containing protein [Paraburkholderia edwinii]|uniref:DUF2946 domain-containing protein n=1 Tax=Paraburkholderia edwinii TaxID=2861782 RepID=A0ABX8URB4_9BURK|nr:DUF2946 domain-containing protein [Paraburkholderia edwinii]QYD69912.1 DUF2946 domain-containing protein [Paraburkholderia edwinii]